MSLSTDFEKLKSDAVAVKDAIVSVADKLPAEAAKVLADVSTIAPVIEAFIPGGSTAITIGENLFNLVAKAVEDAGTAASSNGLSVSFDQAVINDVKAVIAAIKKV